MVAKSGDRFPACAKPRLGLRVWINASAGEGRSEKIMRRQKGIRAVILLDWNRR
jgi:hypothetical protein